MRRAALLTVVACLALAGCSIGGPAGTATPAQTATDEPPQAGTPTPSDRSGTPTPAPTDANTIAFADLSPAAQEAFTTTRRPSGLAIFVPESPHIEGDTFPPEAAEPFAEFAYVEKNGALFRVRLTRGTMYSSYEIRAAPADPDADATVVPLANVTESRRDAVRSAIENGSYTAELGWWRSSGIDAEYVRYENETYRLTVITGDYLSEQLRVDPV